MNGMGALPSDKSGGLTRIQANWLKNIGLDGREPIFNLDGNRVNALVVESSLYDNETSSLNGRSTFWDKKMKNQAQENEYSSPIHEWFVECFVLVVFCPLSPFSDFTEE